MASCDRAPEARKRERAVKAKVDAACFLEKGRKQEKRIKGVLRVFGSPGSPNEPKKGPYSVPGGPR
jgi:hypothetical protein